MVRVKVNARVRVKLRRRSEDTLSGSRSHRCAQNLFDQALNLHTKVTVRRLQVGIQGGAFAVFACEDSRVGLGSCH